MGKEKIGLKLIKAAANGNKDRVEKILRERNADVNAQNGDGNTALHLTTANGYEEIIKILLNAKANVNLVNYAGQTAITYAANSGTLPPCYGSMDIADLHRVIAIATLLENGGNNDLTNTCRLHNERKGQLLLFATERNMIQAVKALLKIGVCINYDNEINTALDIATQNKNTKLTQIILEEGGRYALKSPNELLELSKDQE